MDLCTGTGCIALLLLSLLAQSIPRLHIHGIDISPHAVQLAQENLRSNLAARRLAAPGPEPSSSSLSSSLHSLEFSEGDIFSSDAGALWMRHAPWDVLVCNPPYVSTWGFAHQTERSVRKYEPKLAQVPMVAYPGNHQPEDVFYARLLDVGARTRARIMLFEVGDLAQALRVVQMVWAHQGLKTRGEVAVDIWRDWPDAAPREDEETSRMVETGEESREVKIKGSGHGRSVFIQCN